MSETSPPPAGDPKSVRRRRLLWLGAAVIAVAAAVAAWKLLSNPALRTTDDAYVGGDVVQVTPEISGTVIRLFADDTDQLTAGAPAVELDPTDAKIELASAEDELAQAVRNVRGLYASDARSAADVQLRQAELTRAEADLRARKLIANTGAVTQEDVRHASDATLAARAALAAAEQARVQALTQTDGATIGSNPAVQHAAERVRAAALALQRTNIIAPVTGMVAQRVVQLGQRVGPGDRLMALVPLTHLWVDANFKEVQLKGVCAGQSATITADIYGKSVIYHGHVDGIEAGTGAAFALLPAQNATGNWIKVVQRAPVRISLDPAELGRNPLRIGMSTEVIVDAGHCDPHAAKRLPVANDASALFDAQAQAADAVVAKVIEANIGER